MVLFVSSCFTLLFWDDRFYRYLVIAFQILVYRWESNSSIDWSFDRLIYLNAIVGGMLIYGALTFILYYASFFLQMILHFIRFVLSVCGPFSFPWCLEEPLLVPSTHGFIPNGAQRCPSACAGENPVLRWLFGPLDEQPPSETLFLPTIITIIIIVMILY